MEEWEGRALGSHPANLGSSGAEGVDRDEGGDIPASASCGGALGCCWIPAGSLRSPEARGCSRGADTVVSGTKGPLLAGTPHVG